jgi:YgiT-type zinc finger domain-containing protein
MADDPQPARACPTCGGTDMRQGVKTQTITYEGLESPPYGQPGLWCQDCGEGLLSFEEMEVGAREMHKLKVRLGEIDEGKP